MKFSVKKSKFWDLAICVCPISQAEQCQMDPFFFFLPAVAPLIILLARCQTESQQTLDVIVIMGDDSA